MDQDAATLALEQSCGVYFELAVPQPLEPTPPPAPTAADDADGEGGGLVALENSCGVFFGIATPRPADEQALLSVKVQQQAAPPVAVATVSQPQRLPRPRRPIGVNTDDVLLRDDQTILDMINAASAQLLLTPALEWNNPTANTNNTTGGGKKTRAVGRGSSSIAGAALGKEGEPRQEAADAVSGASTQTPASPLSFGDTVLLTHLFDALHLAKYYETFVSEDPNKEDQELALVAQLFDCVQRCPHSNSAVAATDRLEKERQARIEARVLAEKRWLEQLLQHKQKVLQEALLSDSSRPVQAIVPERDVTTYRLPSSHLPTALCIETNSSVRFFDLQMTSLGRRQHLVTFILMVLFCPNVQEIRLPGHLCSDAVLATLCHVIRKHHPSLRLISVPRVVLSAHWATRITASLRDNPRITTFDLGSAATNTFILPAHRRKVEGQAAENARIMRNIEGMRSPLTWTNVPTDPLPPAIKFVMATV